MSLHQFTIEVEIDEEALRKHHAEKPDEYPIVGTPDAFFGRDLLAAIDRGIADEPEIVDYTCLDDADEPA
jgi:hypothetical protein